jgi:hypothetical protein
MSCEVVKARERVSLITLAWDLVDEKANTPTRLPLFQE